jgi:hypothetical protein
MPPRWILASLRRRITTTGDPLNVGVAERLIFDQFRLRDGWLPLRKKQQELEEKEPLLSSQDKDAMTHAEQRRIDVIEGSLALPHDVESDSSVNLAGCTLARIYPVLPRRFNKPKAPMLRPTRSCGPTCTRTGCDIGC